MLKKHTKMKIIFGLFAATLALTVSMPNSGSISLISNAMAYGGESGGGGGEGDGGGQAGGGNGLAVFNNMNGVNFAIKRCKQAAQWDKLAAASRRSAARDAARGDLIGEAAELDIARMRMNRANNAWRDCQV